MARRHGLPFAPDALERVRDTPSQTGLDRTGRRRNVHGAFRAKRSPGCRIWLVDDVITTGATAHAAALALGLAGSREILCLAAARTPAPLR